MITLLLMMLQLYDAVPMVVKYIKRSFTGNTHTPGKMEN